MNPTCGKRLDEDTDEGEEFVETSMISSCVESAKSQVSRVSETAGLDGSEVNVERRVGGEVTGKSTARSVWSAKRDRKRDPDPSQNPFARGRGRLAQSIPASLGFGWAEVKDGEGTRA